MSTSWYTPIPLVLDVDNFRAWVDRQPPDVFYSYSDITGCAVARYLMALGCGPVQVGGLSYGAGTSGPAEGHIPLGLALLLGDQPSPQCFGDLSLALRQWEADR